MRQLKLFISYCHADLEPRPGFNVSRVGRILDEVKHELNCHSSRSRFKILRDVEVINVSDDFREKIRKAITACDMAILFLSDNFNRSEECEDEFVQLVAAGKPLFLVETEPPFFNDDQDRIKKHRTAVKNILSAKFWGVDNDQKSVRFGYPLPDTSTTRDRYYEALEVLVAGLKARAAALPPAADDLEEDPQGHTAVFVACPTTDVKPEAMRLASALEADGHSVRRFDPDLDVRDASSFSPVLSDAVAKCDVYVQLLGATPGKNVPGTELRLVRTQYEMAKKAGKPVFVWCGSHFDMEELAPDYGAFLKEIAPACQIGNYVEFEEYLKKKLNEIAAQQRSDDRRARRLQEPDVVSSWPFVAIDAAPADRDFAQKIADALVKYVNVDHLDYDLTGQKLADAVVDNNALILAYGKSIEGQKRTQAHFKLIRRPKAELSFKGLELAVGNGAPPTAPPCPRGPNVHVITVADEVDSVAISTFLKKLGVSVPQENEAR
jgi:hypothetical protein